MTSATRAREWSEIAISRLEDRTACPRCDRTLTGPRCGHCGADYAEGDVGLALWDASQAAIAALVARQAVLDRVPVSATPVVAAPVSATSVPAAAPPTVAAAPPTPPSKAATRSSATVQSVLAVAGAGLVAVAAIVFTFFNPDVTDPLSRGLIVGAVSLVFLVGARVLARRALQFSAEAVGALGLVFLGLDVHALTAVAPDDRWAVAALATALASVAMTWLGLRAGVRAWVWGPLLALAVVPAMVGYALGLPVVGHLATAVAAFGLIAATPALARRLGVPLRAERATLTVVQLVGIAVALAQATVFGMLPPDAVALSFAGLLAAGAALAAFSTRHPLPRVWSFLAGALAVGAAAVLPFALPAGILDAAPWSPIAAAASVAGAILVACVLPMPATMRRTPLSAGALVVVGLVATPLLLTGAVHALSTLLRESDSGSWSASGPAWIAAGLAALSVGLCSYAALQDRLHPPAAPRLISVADADADADADAPAVAPLGARWVGYVGLWIAGAAAIVLLCVPQLALELRVALGIALGAATAAGVALVPALARARLAVRVPLVVGAHVVVLFAMILSWRDAQLTVLAGAFVVAATALLARPLAPQRRFVHVGAGYAYALVVFAIALSLQGIAGVALLCLTTSAGAVVAIAATFIPRVRARSWYAVLAVTSVPFLLGVAQVVFERSAWTALSTGIIFLLALTLVLTRRAGLGIPLRLAAAAILVPSLAVVIVCLGAQLLAASGSPVVLPLIATLVALVLPSGALLRSRLEPRIGGSGAAWVRLAIEASTLVSAAIAVALALVREAAGLPTTLIVLLIIGVGGVATALWGGRRYGWWLAGVAVTGALWCAWSIAGVAVLEPYLLPPALGAVVIGVLLTARGRNGVALYAAGLLLAIVPLVVLAAVSGPPVRALGLVAASWLLVALGRAWRNSLAVLRPVTLAAAIIAGAAGAVLGVRLGSGLDDVDLAVPLIVVCLAVSIAGAAPAALAASLLRSGAPDGTRRGGSRWLAAPAFAYVGAGAWMAIERDWFAIWTMWGVMAAYLVALVIIARRGLRGRTGLPPVWFVFALAFATAVAAWSPRDLRVEWFSLPLGAALLIAGALAMRAGADGQRATPDRWPSGFTGSWALLAPGIVVMLSASIAATFTDPLTWRAILVIVLALVAILVGAGRRLAAPFLIGIVVLPVENAIAFLVQIGRGIESMPWWITLAVVGAVLLIIAVTYERRAGEQTGIAARLRDLA